MSDLISDIPTSVIRELYDEIAAGIPEEKVKQDLAMAATARAMQAEGSLRTRQGLGQKIGSIPGRVYFRWQNEFPGCWSDPEFVEAFLADNPQCCAPGYKPKQHALRHGKSFVEGKPV